MQKKLGFFIALISLFCIVSLFLWFNLFKIPVNYCQCEKSNLSIIVNREVVDIHQFIHTQKGSQNVFVEKTVD